MIKKNRNPIVTQAEYTQQLCLDLAPLRQTILEASPRRCDHCGSGNFKIGAGRKGGEQSIRCTDCKFFLGYSPVSRLKKARKRRELTECLQILEKQGIQSEIALFTLSLADDNGGAV